jgi:hypothetical protein
MVKNKIMRIDRKNESKICRLCDKKYNHEENRPVCLMPCGHTYCRKCTQIESAQINTKRTCPACKLGFNQIIPDYAMLDMINSTAELSLSRNSSESSSHEIIDNQNSEEIFEEKDEENKALISNENNKKV